MWVIVRAEAHGYRRIVAARRKSRLISSPTSLMGTGLRRHKIEIDTRTREANGGRPRAPDRARRGGPRPLRSAAAFRSIGHRAFPDETQNEPLCPRFALPRQRKRRRRRPFPGERRI